MPRQPFTVAAMVKKIFSRDTRADGRGAAPLRLDQFQPVVAVADDRRQLIGIDAAGRQVSGAVGKPLDQPGQRLLRGRHVIPIADRPILALVGLRMSKGLANAYAAAIVLGCADQPFVRISEEPDSDFTKSRTAVSVSPGQLGGDWSLGCCHSSWVMISGFSVWVNPGLAVFRRMLSPLSSMRWALWMMRSRMASAMVGSPII